jgi:hypothetical protein
MFHPTRQFLAAAFAVASTLLAPVAHAAADEDALIRRAFVYAFPIHEMGRLLLGGAPAAAGAPFVHRRTLASPADRGVTTPNNDTLYSTARLNLAAGPVKLTVPDTQGRYYAVAFIDAATDNFATVGQRTTGTRAGDFIVVGPDWISPLPDGARVIRAPGNDVLVLLRIGVRGPSDVAAVQRLQDGFLLTAMPSAGIAAVAPASSAASAPAATAAAPVARPDQPATAERFLAIVNRMLARNPPPSYERVLLERFAAVGVCGAGCGWDALPPPVQARWNALLPDMMAQLQRRAHDSAQQPNGWSAPRPTIGNFGTDYEARAEVALTGLLALEPAEAMYFTARQDGAHHPLTGTHVYRLHLPPGSIPVEGFWSLTMYEQNFDGRLYLVNNPIDRYAIGDRTPGLRRNRDGSIDIWIQRAEPGRSRRDNWLPAPPGPFVLTLRAYEPRLALRDGRFVLPPVESVE